MRNYTRTIEDRRSALADSLIWAHQLDLVTPPPQFFAPITRLSADLFKARPCHHLLIHTRFRGFMHSTQQGKV
ncbi:MAG: hypothetical protein KJO21_11730, partial [Verrucomicrobiae bacterium]|nr:hypothetical protein [Verrucomicrobiae bacterium]